MKHWSITKRLHATLFFILLFSVAGGGLVWWAERRTADSQAQAAAGQERVLVGAARLRQDALVMDGVLRGWLLGAKAGAETARKLEADEDFTQTMEGLRPALVGRTNLIVSLEVITTHYTKQVVLSEQRLLAQLGQDRAGAMQFYATNYLLAQIELERKIENFRLRAQGYAAGAGFTPVSEIIGLSAALVLLLVSVGLASSLATAVHEPLKQLVAAMERMRGGDFTERLSVRGENEFGQLAEGLNRMGEELTTLVGQVQQSGAQVNTSAVEIAATARQQHATAGEVASTTAELRGTSQRILTTAHELVKTISEVTGVVERAAKMAGSSQEMLVRMGSTMKQITTAAGGINARLAVLNEKAGNINQVVTTIAKVADQTNLLSLNAAIEAEKAGDYGRGFGVVASEIRRLADQTAEATFDIEQMVKEMQTAVSSGVMSMDKFTEEVRRGVADVQQGSTELARIIQQVQALTPHFDTVNTGMRSQAGSAEQISTALAQLNDSAQQTVASLRQSAQAIERLNEATLGLQSGVARFKIPGEASSASLADQVQS